jgi:hypothetical protein
MTAEMIVLGSEGMRIAKDASFSLSFLAKRRMTIPHRHVIQLERRWLGDYLSHRERRDDDGYDADTDADAAADDDND